ncbi:MAG: formylglycine-generating enzyme family protein [bacterium]
MKRQLLLLSVILLPMMLYVVPSLSAVDYDSMVLIPEGDFPMGSKDGDRDERPVHKVFLKAFYIDKTEVSNRMFKKFTDENPEWSKKNADIGKHDGDYLKLWKDGTYPPQLADHPVVYVSWFAANAYAKWAGKRLPLEAEWEKAATYNQVNKKLNHNRKYKWSFGNNFDPQAANTAHFHGLEIGALWADWWSNFEKDISSKQKKGETTTPVGNFPVGVNGLYDMTGNVWEWCQDWYQGDAYIKEAGIKKDLKTGSTKTKMFSFLYEASSVKDSAPVGGVYRIIRGGSWTDDYIISRSSNRFRFKPSHTYDDIGFRCVITAPPGVKK